MRISAFALTLLLGANLAAAPVPKELKRRPDAVRIQGIWMFDPPTSTRWYFNGDKLYSYEKENSDNLGTEYGILLSPEHSPGRLDITEKGRVICTGIYKFDGDSLTLCYVSQGERPVDFQDTPTRTIRRFHRDPDSKK